MLRIFLRNVAIKISFVYITSLTLTFYIICAFFLEESNLVAKVRKLVGLRVHFIFSVVLPQNLTQMFSKSAQGDSCKWQICTFSLHSLNRILDCLAYCPLGFHSFMHVKRLKWWRLCRNVYKKNSDSSENKSLKRQWIRKSRMFSWDYLFLGIVNNLILSYLCTKKIS